MAENRGRPRKLTKEVQESIINFLKMGNFLETAAAFNGLHASTVRYWIARGKRELQRVEANKTSKIKQSEAPFVDFFVAVERADAEGEIRFVSLMYQAAKEDPNIAYRMLMSGRYPRWKNNGAQNIESVTEQAETYSLEDMDALRAKLTRRLLKLQGLPTDALEQIEEE